MPDSLLVLGGGYVALELAQLFARLGSTVTMLVRSRLASKEEPEVSTALEAVFADEGIRVVRRAQLQRDDPGPADRPGGRDRVRRRGGRSSFVPTRSWSRWAVAPSPRG